MTYRHHRTWSSESKFRKAAMDFLKDAGGYWYKVADRYKSGMPDIIGWRHGKSYAFELKSTKNKPTKLQLYILGEMAKQGVLTKVCYTLADLAITIEQGDKS